MAKLWHALTSFDFFVSIDIQKGSHKRYLHLVFTVEVVFALTFHPALLQNAKSIVTCDRMLMEHIR